MATNLGPWEVSPTPEAIQFQRPARRLERRQAINDTSIRSIKPPATGAVDYFDDLTPEAIAARDVQRRAHLDSLLPR